MKKVFIILLILLTIFFIFVATKNVLTKKTIEIYLEEELEVNVNIKDLDISFLGNHLRIEGLTIDNPSGFAKREFAYIPLINIVCNPFEYWINKELNIYYLELDIERINVIKDKDGKVNLKQFKVLERKEPEGGSGIIVEILKLSLNDVYYIDYTNGKSPKIVRYSIGIKDTAFGNLNSFEDVVHLVILKAISETKIGKLINMTVAPLAENVKDIVFISKRTLGDTLKSVFSLPFLFKKSRQ